MKNKKYYNLIIKTKNSDYIIDIQKHLTIEQAEERYNKFIGNGYYQMATCIIEEEKGK